MILIVSVVFISILPCKYFLASAIFFKQCFTSFSISSSLRIYFLESSAACPCIKINDENTSQKEKHSIEGTQKSVKWISFHPCKLN